VSRPSSAMLALVVLKQGEKGTFKRIQFLAGSRQETLMKDADSGKPLYYGWKIVGAILVLLTFASGLSFYNHAIYLDAVAARPDFSVGSASTAVSVFFLSGGVAGLGVGRWVRDFDPRYCISAGAIACFAALSLMPLVANLAQLFLVYSLFGAGFAASGLIPATTLITRWFNRRRAMALSIASTGLSLGGVILTPLCVLLVETLGFNTAAPIMGSLYLLGVIPVALIWLRPEPASLGLTVNGLESVAAQPNQDEREPGTAKREIELGISFKLARKGWLFWAICLAYIFLMLAQVAGIAHQYGLIRETLSESRTALAVAIIPVASIIGRLLGGWVVEQISIRVFAASMMVLQAISLTLLASGLGAVVLCLGLFVFGTSVGNLLMLQPLLLAEAFGVRDYARIFSISNLMSSWGTAAGPALIGLVYTASGNEYSLPYLIAAGAGFAGMLLFLSGGRLRGRDG